MFTANLAFKEGNLRLANSFFTKLCFFSLGDTMQGTVQVVGFDNVAKLLQACPSASGSSTNIIK